MINFISKVLDLLAHPFGWIVVLLLLAACLKGRKVKTWCYGGAAFLFLFFSNTTITRFFVDAWENAQATPWPTGKHYTYCFVPGGLTEGYDSAYGTVSYREAVDRMHTAALFVKEGICDTILVSGDGANNFNGGNPEGFALHAQRLFGIDAACIKNERYALTTMQNFQYSIPMMQQGNCITVNSARYMARTRQCARLQHFDTDFFSVQLIVNKPEQQFMWVELIPRWKNFEKWYDLFHELGGYVWYAMIY